MGNEEQQWYDLAAEIEQGIGECIQRDELTTGELFEFVRIASGSLLRQERFENPFKGKTAEIPLTQLYVLMQHAMGYEGTVSMVPLQMSLYKAGQLSLKEFVEYLRDSVLIAGGFEIEAKGERARGEENNDVEDRFNYLLDKIEDYEQADEYVKAIEALDEAFAMAEKEPLLVYDRCTMYNNRAYYNFQLGNFEKALKDCETAIGDTEEGIFYHTKAEILHAMKRYDEALAAIAKAIELEPTPDKLEFQAKIARSR